MLGTTRVGLGTFVVATLGHVPSYFAEVYVGYAAGHVTRVVGGATPHDVGSHMVTFAGLAMSLAAVAYVATRAVRAVREAEARIPRA